MRCPPVLKPLLVIVVVFLYTSPSFAFSIFTFFSGGDATVIWDGTADVRTSQNISSPTTMDRYSNLGISDPAFLAIAFHWRGLSSTLQGSITINKVALIISVDDGACLGHCLTPRQFLTSEGFALPNSGFTAPPNLDRNVVAFAAIMGGSPVTVHYPHGNFLFRLSSGDAARLRMVLASYNAANLRVGLAVLSGFDGDVHNASPTFQVRSAVHRTGDYDGDGRADFSVFRPNSAAWYVLNSRDGNRTGTGTFYRTGTGTYWGYPGDVPVPGDYDGDDKTDHAVYRPSNGAWDVLQTGTGTGVRQYWGAPGDVPVPADYDGDGRTDHAVYRPSSGVWWIFPSGQPSMPYILDWGFSEDLPVPADFDGDGRADPTVFRPSTGAWYQFRSTTGTGFAVIWGARGDIPLAGDYDGDGKADPTVFRSHQGTWYQLRSTDGPWFGGYWGLPGDVPLVGDYDGDGKADLTVFRPSTSTWYQLRSMTGMEDPIVWGVTGDVPTVRPVKDLTHWICSNGICLPPGITRSCNTWVAPGGVISVSAAGGKMSPAVLVEPVFSCPWRAWSDVSWITVTYPAYLGIHWGDGNVVFTVQANTTGVQRVGQIRVAETILTVVQFPQ